MRGVTYDTGALLAAGRGDRRMRVLHARLTARGIVPVVPTPVLAQVWREGPRHANLARLLAVCDSEALSEAQARRVGVLAGKARHSDIVDLTVVEGATRRGDGIVTSNARDIEAIARAAGARLVIEHI